MPRLRRDEIDFDGFLPRPKGGGWDQELVSLRFQSAFITLRRLPAHDAKFALDKLRAVWPDVPRRWTEYGAVKVSARPPVPTARAITLMQEVLDWYVTHLTPENRPEAFPADIGAICWARAAGLKWKMIIAMRSTKPKSERRGNNRVSLAFYEKETYRWLAEVLNDLGVEPRMP